MGDEQNSHQTPTMSCDKDRPVSLIEMFDLFLTQPGRPWPLFTLPITCTQTKTQDSSTVNTSFISKFIHQHHCVFPTAYCLSYKTQQDSTTAYDENELEKDLRLPGIQAKKIVNPSKIVSEFDINQLMATESGWDRVKHMYRMKSGVFEDDCLQVLNTLWYRTTLMGFFFSAMAASLRHDKAEKSLSKTDAMRKGIASQVLIPKEVLTTALKDTLKLSILSFSFFHLSQTISAYKNKSSVWEFSLSSAIGFGVLRITQGAYTFGIAVAGGAVFGTVAGWLACRVLQSCDLTQESRTMKRMKQRVEELRLETQG